MPIDNFRLWSRSQFAAYKGCIAFVETASANGDIGCGTCFHVGEGVFVTARHVIENRPITKIGFDDDTVNQELLQDRRFWGEQQHGRVSIVEGPFFHSNQNVDVACFRVEPFPKAWLPLGGHLDDFLGQHELLLYRTLVIGYPPIPLTTEPKLVASVGEVNALVDLYVGSHPHFIISTMARGGFSGAPVLVAYNEDNTSTGTAVLGIVTQSLVENNKAPEHGFMAVLSVEPIFTCLELNNMLPKGQGYE